MGAHEEAVATIREALREGFGSHHAAEAALDSLVAALTRAQDESDLEAQSERRAYWRARAEKAEAQAQQMEKALAEVQAGFNAYFNNGDLDALLRTEATLRRLSPVPQAGEHG